MKILITCTLLFCASLCWGDYSTSYQTGLTDITANLSTVNAWKIFPQGGSCKPNSLRIGGDGYTMCLAGSNGYPYYTTARASSWQPLTAMGNGMASLGVVDAEHIYALWSDGTIKFWNGSSWTTPNTGAWLQQFNAAPGDGTLVGVASNTTYESTNGGSSWFAIAGGSFGPPYLSYVSAASTTSLCGIASGVVYALLGSQTAFTQLSAQPGVTPAGCVIYEGDSPGIMIWTSAGVAKLYDIGNGTWSTVAGTIFGLTAETKAKTLGLDVNGYPYHLNVYAGYISGTTTGQVNGCPPPATCNNGITHTGTIRLTFPHGIFGAWGQQSVSPTTTMNVSSFDASPACDPLFGDPNDPECFPTAAGDVHCNQSGFNFDGSATKTPPPHYQYSENYVKWDNTRVLISSFLWKGNGWSSTERCFTSISGCTVGTIPYCGDDSLDFHFNQRPSTKTIADQGAAFQCLTGPWATTAVYYPGIPNSCVQVSVDRHAKTPQPCF